MEICVICGNILCRLPINTRNTPTFESYSSDLKRRAFYTVMKKTGVLCTYLLFFTVQIFFNLDTGKKISARNIYVQRAGNITHTSTVKKTVDAPYSKSKIRLNKRFEPSSIPCNFTALEEARMVYTAPLVLGEFSTSFHSSVFLETHSLRGPPVVA